MIQNKRLIVETGNLKKNKKWFLIFASFYMHPWDCMGCLPMINFCLCLPAFHGQTSCFVVKWVCACDRHASNGKWVQTRTRSSWGSWAKCRRQLCCRRSDPGLAQNRAAILQPWTQIVNFFTKKACFLFLRNTLSCSNIHCFILTSKKFIKSIVSSTGTGSPLSAIAVPVSKQATGTGIPKTSRVWINTS